MENNMDNNLDYTSPSFNLSYDMNKNTTFKLNDENYINTLSKTQLPALLNLSLLDIFLSEGHVVEPHYHQNQAELVYTITGKVQTSVLNPYTNKLLTYQACPGEVIYVPRGWWHWDIGLVDNTHFLAIFDWPYPDVILGSDILRKTPTEILSHTYCLNNKELKLALAPLKETVFIGPPNGCRQTRSTSAPAPTLQQYPGSHVTPIQDPYNDHLQYPDDRRKKRRH
jgi:quercetin dioxygenase-like cupin family protein